MDGPFTPEMGSTVFSQPEEDASTFQAHDGSQLGGRRPPGQGVPPPRPLPRDASGTAGGLEAAPALWDRRAAVPTFLTTKLMSCRTDFPPPPGSAGPALPWAAGLTP